MDKGLLLEIINPKLNLFRNLFRKFEFKNDECVMDNKTIKENIQDNGFVHIRMIENELIELLSNGINNLVMNNIPPTFIYCYEEAWDFISLYYRNLTDVSGNFIGDIYAWKVNPQLQQSGWNIHRDRLYASKDMSFTSENYPKLLTTWIAMTPTNEDTSCMYFVNKKDDEENYYENKSEINISEMITKSQSISCSPGDCIHFSHRVLHYGSKPKLETSPPRISMSFVMGDYSFEKPMLKNIFPQRFQDCYAMCSAQMICYNGQTKYPNHIIKNYFRIFEKSMNVFGDEYIMKVKEIYYLHNRNNTLSLSKKEKSATSEIPDEPLCINIFDE